MVLSHMATTKIASSLTLLPLASMHIPRGHILPPSTSPIPRQARCKMTAKTSVPLSLRRSGNYPPSLWDDDYLQSLRSDSTVNYEEDTNQIKKLKEGVKSRIEQEKGIVEQLELVDTVQQLGLGYHFETEIMDVLGNISESMEDVNMAMEQDLYAKSLLFRLLREHGFSASQDIFNSFKDGTGNFKAYLSHDIRGLLSLYQASYFAVDGENTMDEATEFTTTHLNNLKKGNLEPCLMEHITYALAMPLNWRMPRLHNKWFIERYERGEKKYSTLLEFAKLDFNMVQNIQKRELSELSRWWTNLDLLEDKLSFSRDRLVENYFLSIGLAPEPRLWRCREAMTKCICLATTIDDVYDVYGSLNELELFTDVVERWEISAIEKLPEYMKICFLALFNTTNDIAYKILKDKRVDIIPYLQKAWKDLCKSYLEEAKWYDKGCTPTLQEYMENAWISIGGPLGLTIADCTNEDVTMEALECFKSYSNIIRLSSMIFRLSNDLATSTAELERGDVPKSIQCHMHEKGVSEIVARQHVRDLISVNWKQLNGDCFVVPSIEKIFRTTALNVPRTTQCIYQHGDGYGKQTDRETKNCVVSLFIEPIF